MTTKRVLVGMPAGSAVAPLTAKSIYDLAQIPQVGVMTTAGPVVLELFFAIHAFGYTEVNVWTLAAAAQASGYDYFLRVDADMAWSPAWMGRFLRDAIAVECLCGAERPFLAGGVYLNRARGPRYPLVVPLDAARWTDGALWALACRERAATVNVARVGGGWQLWNRALLEAVTFDDLRVDPDLGEDYRVCDGVRARDGTVVAVWPGPRADDPQLFHGTGKEPADLEVFFAPLRARYSEREIRAAVRDLLPLLGRED